MSNTVEFILIDESAQKPSKGTKESVGFDLYCPTDITLKGKEVTKIALRLKLALPPWLWVQILDRSSMGKKGLTVFGGVIDPDYQGEISVMIYNTNYVDYEIKKGDRIAQMIFHYAITPSMVDHEITYKVRNEGGFGSTGK